MFLFYIFAKSYGGLDSLVGLATGYGLDRSEFESS